MAGRPTVLSPQSPRVGRLVWLLLLLLLPSAARGATEDLDFRVVSYTGKPTPSGNTIATLGTGPSINDDGVIAYTAVNSAGAVGVMVDGEAQPRSAFCDTFRVDFGTTMSGLSRNFHFGDVAQINSQNRVAWKTWSRDGLFAFIFRQGATPEDFKIVAKTLYHRIDNPIFDLPSPFEGPFPFPWTGISPNLTQDNTGRVVFGAILADTPNHTVLATPVDPDAGWHDEASDFHLSDALLNVTNFFPQISNRGQVAARGGRTSTAPILVFNDPSLEVSGATFIATQDEFKAMGERPGLSDDGRVVAFMGDHKTDGVGIYSAILEADGSMRDRPFKLTGGCEFAAFTLSARVAVNRRNLDAPHLFTALYLAYATDETDGGTGPLGLYATTLDLTDPDEPLIYAPYRVTYVGDDILGPSEPLQSIALDDPLNNRGQLVFWATTATRQAILTAELPTFCPLCECQAAQVDCRLDGVRASIGLGGSRSGINGALEIRSDRPHAGLGTPQALRVTGTLSEFERVCDAHGLRQVKGPHALADIRVLDDFSYEVRFFTAFGPRNANTGLYLPSGEPFARVLVENPDRATSSNRLRLTPSNGHPFTYAYSAGAGGWELASGSQNAARQEHERDTIAGSRRTRTRTVRDSAGNILSQTVEVYQRFGWGESLLETTEGVPPNTRNITYAYYTNLTDGFNYGQRRNAVHSNGYWEYYRQYGSRGLLKSVRQFRHQPYAESGVWPDPDNRSSEVSYAGDLETYLEYLAGRLVAKRWVARVAAGETWECVATDPATADWRAPSNLITRTYQYLHTDAAGARAGQTRKVLHPDGTMTLYRYVAQQMADPFAPPGSGRAIPVRLTLSYSGQPNGALTDITEGVRTSLLEDPFGNLLSRKEYDIRTSLLTDSEMVTARDAFGRPTRFEYLDGTFVTRVYDCCGLASETDREGVTTTFNTQHLILLDLNQDGTNEVYYGNTVLRAGITTHTLTDPLGRGYKTILEGTDGTLIVQDERRYTVLGDLEWSKDALGRLTTYTETEQGGFTVRTTIFPDGGQSSEASYPDGSAFETRGSAVAGVRYSYDVRQDNGRWVSTVTQTRLEKDGNLSPEYTTTYSDFAGRANKTEYPWPDGNTNVFEVRIYNAKGQLASSTDPDGLTTLYVYNGRGELETVATDVANAGVIDFAGTDRITRTTSLVENSALRGAVVRKTVTELWELNGTNRPTALQLSETSADGAQTWSTQYGLTTHTRTETDRANQRRTVTARNADGTSTVSVFAQGRQVSVTRYDANTNRVTQTTFAYDAFGRLQSQTDARNGATTYAYYDDGPIRTVTTPDPDPDRTGPGYDPQTTAYTYFRDLASGTKTITTLPDGGVVTHEYFPDGQLKKTWGARTYPAAYTYDRAGRVETLTTWQQFDFASGTGLGGEATTRWNYNARGLLANKRYVDNKGPSYTYTAGGKPKTRLWARGVLTTYGYDPQAGDLLTTIYSDTTPAVTNTYDRLGRLQTVLDASGLRTFGYHRDRTVTEAYGPGLFEGLTLVRDYDDLDRQAALSVHSPNEAIYHVTYGYDAASRLDAVISGPDVARYTYHPDSDMVHTLTQSHSNAVRLVTTKLFDKLGRLQSITSVPSADEPIRFAYDHNAANQRTRATLANGEHWNYAYDFLGQVTNAVKHLPTGTPIPGYSFGYQFDPIGNRQLASRDGQTDQYTNNLLNQVASVAFAPWLHVLGMVNTNASITVNGQTPVRSNGYFYAQLAATSLWNTVSIQARAVGQATTGTDALAEEAGHLFQPTAPVSLQYDDDGNLLSDGRWSMTWDAENRVIKKESLPNVPQTAQSRLEYRLDAHGRRVRVTLFARSSDAWTPLSDQSYLASDFELLAELDAVRNTAARSFTWGQDLSGTRADAGGIGGLLSVRQQSTHLTTFDGNGNVAGLLRADNGVKSAGYEYAPFGNILRMTGVAAKTDPFRFSTKFCEEETGDVHYEYRDYAPAVGRWRSRDPAAEVGAANLFGLLANDPINSIDPTGLLKFTFNKKKCILKGPLTWSLRFENRPGFPKWSFAQRAIWKRAAETAVEDFFKNTGFRCYSGSTTCCLCPKGVSVDLNLRYKGFFTFWRHDDYVVTVVPDPLHQSWVSSTSGSGTAEFDVDDVNPQNKGASQPQVPIVHETGHMLGLQHPGGANNSASAYLADFDSLMGGGGILRLSDFNQAFCGRMSTGSTGCDPWQGK